MHSVKSEQPLLRVPHFSWFQAFIVVAKKQSFTLASCELHLSQSAISQQVAKLETLFNSKLFFRDTKQVTLTEAGEKLLAQIEGPFNSLLNAVEVFQQESCSYRLNIEAEPVLSRILISPQLPQFLSCNPDILLRQALTTHHFDFMPETELAIKWGDGKWDGFDAQFLCSLDYVPVCSPEYRDKLALSSLENLHRATLLHERDYTDWIYWLKYYPEANLNIQKGHVAGESDVLMSMTMAGLGVSLCGYELIQEHLDSKRLVLPFPELTVRHHKAYYILTHSHAELSPAAKNFIAFLHDIVLMKIQT